MESQGYNVNKNHPIANGIDQAMLIRYTPTPKSLLLSFQRFGLANSCKRMANDILKQGRDTFHNTFVACLLPVLKVFVRPGKEYYFHNSSILTTRPRPFLMSSCPCRITSAMAGEDIRYSVSSIVFFWAAILFNAFNAFFIRPSSSAMILSSRNSSAFNCNVVIFLSFLFPLQKYKKFFLEQPRRSKTRKAQVTPHKVKPQCGAQQRLKTHNYGKPQTCRKTVP